MTRAMRDAIADAETLMLVNRDDPWFSCHGMDWMLDPFLSDLGLCKLLGLVACKSINGFGLAAIAARHSARAAFRAIPDLKYRPEAEWERSAVASEPKELPALTPCISRAGVKRAAHDYDRDGICLFCPEASQ